MPAPIIELADAVVTALNAADWSQEFTAERAYVPIFDLKDVQNTLKVVVVPLAQSLRAADRTRFRFHYLVDIGVLKKPATLDNTALDALMLLVGEMVDWFADLSLLGATARVMPTKEGESDAVRNNPIYDSSYLVQNRQFASLITVNFGMWRT